MLPRWLLVLGLAVALTQTLVGCGGGSSSTGRGGSSSTGAGGSSSTGGGGSSSTGAGGSSQVPSGPNGNPDGHCAVPNAALAEDVSSPTTVVGTGTPSSCTPAALASAVAAGGVVTFDCGADPITITLTAPIRIVNDGGKTGDGSVTIDGGGLVTLSGGGKSRVLYQDTCDQALHFTSTHCQAQATPHLVVQNIAFADGSATATSNILGGGAIYVGGGTFKAFNIRVTGSTQPNLGQDYSGGAIYTFNQATAPVTIVNSTFDGDSGSNGGALGSIGTSWSIYNSVLSNNKALGNGANPAKAGTPGGGLGGAIYNDGNDYTLTICGTALTNNTAAELGSGSIFEVVDDLKGGLHIDQSTFTGNSNTGSVQSSAHPSIYVEAADKVGNAGVQITATTFN